VSLRIVPVNRDKAFAFVERWHRHLSPPVGNMWAVGVADNDTLVGVAIAGRPVARHYQDGLTVEVTRCATDGTRNACSALYGAVWRAAKALGYMRALTYTHATTYGPACADPCRHGSCLAVRLGESGSALRGAGWLQVAHRPPRSGWDVPGRPRSNDGYVSVGRVLWMVRATSAATLPTLVAGGPLVDAEPDPALFDLAVPA
jgi:hypothetical protein